MGVAHKAVVEFCKQYFTDEPDASIDTCCRDAHFLRIPVSKDIASAIRREVRAARPISSVAPKPMLALVAQPPRGFLPDKPPPADLFKVIEAAMPPPEERPAGDEKVPLEIRRRYFEDILLADTKIKINTAMKMVADKYGITVDVGFAVKALKLVREMDAGQTSNVVLPSTPKPSAPKPIVAQQLPKVQAMPVTPPVTPSAPADGRRVVEWEESGKKHYQHTTDKDVRALVAGLISKGVREDDINVLKYLKKKIVVDFE